MSCIFCGIVEGKIPAEVVLRTEAALAFLDHRPLFPGHVLLIPVRHIVTLADCNEILARQNLTFDPSHVEVATPRMMLRRFKPGMSRCSASSPLRVKVSPVPETSWPRLFSRTT